MISLYVYANNGLAACWYLHLRASFILLPIFPPLKPCMENLAYVIRPGFHTLLLDIAGKSRNISQCEVKGNTKFCVFYLTLCL